MRLWIYSLITWRARPQEAEESPAVPQRDRAVYQSSLIKNDDGLDGVFLTTGV